MHWLSCKRNPGRSQRHHFIDDLTRSIKGKFTINQGTTWPSNVWQRTPRWSHSYSMARCSLGYLGCHHSLTQWPLLPEHNIICFSSLSSWSGRQTQEDKYTEITYNYHFFPIAFESFGPINQVGTGLISILGHRISSITHDSREIFYLFQRLSFAIQRFNAVCYANLVGNIDVEARHSQPRHTDTHLVRD